MHRWRRTGLQSRCVGEFDSLRLTECVRGIYDRMAPRFDSKIGFWEKVLFRGGREWACAQAKGDVLEIAVGTGRNLGLYPPDGVGSEWPSCEFPRISAPAIVSAAISCTA